MEEKTEIEIKSFLESDARGRWFDDKSFTVYLRKSCRPYRCTHIRNPAARTPWNCVDVADITVDKSCRGEGIFGDLIEFLARHSPYNFLLIESVSNEILHGWAHRHGWVQVDQHSYYIETPAR